MEWTVIGLSYSQSVLNGFCEKNCDRRDDFANEICTLTYFLIERGDTDKKGKVRITVKARNSYR